MSSGWLTGVGLALGFAGAALMFFFNVPRYPQKSRAGTSALIREEIDEDESRGVAWAGRISKFGVALLAVGFLFQLAGLVS